VTWVERPDIVARWSLHDRGLRRGPVVSYWISPVDDHSARTLLHVVRYYHHASRPFLGERSYRVHLMCGIVETVRSAVAGSRIVTCADDAVFCATCVRAADAEGIIW
jgi:hypothetical protein